MESRSVRFFFSDLPDAALGLLTVLEDARVTKRLYSFGSLTADQVLVSGLLVTGEVDEIDRQLSALPGVVRQEE